MARILVSAASSVYDNGEFQLLIFYEGFVTALIAAGHDVRVINSSNFLAVPWNGSNHLAVGMSARRLIADVRAFDPELIIAFNHSVPRAILDVTMCPVALWNADAITFFNDKDYILKNIDRYSFLSFTQSGCRNARAFGFEKDRIHYVLAATSVVAEARPQDKNISFIGTMFRPPASFQDILKRAGGVRMRALLEDMACDFYGDHDGALVRHDLLWLKDEVPLSTLASLKAMHERVSILNEVEGMGLSIYGGKEWLDLAATLPWLAMCYRPDKIYSLRHNQDIYNESRLCISISHGQVAGGFPWRVMDVMASNGALIHPESVDLRNFTKGYVDIPMFASRVEAVDLCRKFLEDDGLRRDVVAGAQACIEEKGRWTDRINKINDIFGLKVPLTAQSAVKESDVSKIVLRAEKYKRWYAFFFNKIVEICVWILPVPVLRLAYFILVRLGIRAPYAVVHGSLAKKEG